MADAKLNMSLDQIIEATRKPARESRPRQNTGKRSNDKHTKSAPAKPIGVTKRTPTNTKGLKVSIVNQVNKRHLTQGFNRQPANRARNPASAPFSRRPAPEGRWQHDLFEDSEPRTARRQTTSKADGVKLAISNLDFRVTEDDIKELFSSIGPLKSWKLDYDKSGRPEGTAEVIFVNRVDAEKALSQYNGVMLDGKKMLIEIIGQSNANGSSVFSRLSSGPGGSRAGRSGLQQTRMFKQATRDASDREGKVRPTGRMRGYDGDDDVYMDE